MAEVVSFRTNDDFEVKIGRDQKEVRIPRLAFKNSKPVLEDIAALNALDLSTSIQTIAKAGRARIFGNEDIKDYISYIEKTIPILLKKHSYEAVESLLLKISEGVINHETLDLMQYSEAVSLLSYLIDKNFESLKNMTASLAAISSTQKPA